MSGQRVNVAELGRALDITRQSAHELVERGIVERDAAGLVDLEAARAAIANSLHPGSKASQALGDVLGADTFKSARTRREVAEAKLAELKHAELAGLLVRADRVRAEQARLAASIREAFLQMPARLAQVLAAEVNAARVFELLDTELRAVLALLVQTITKEE